MNDLANALRFLSIDAIERAQSGHPGMPLGMADIVTVLWKQFLKHNPKNPHWFNRDRFVLSNGHGSMLLYALLHLTGYNLTIDDLKNFRQLHSKTPGHPEYGETPGVDTTTGPLGQGLANAVGMAIAEKLLATEFNRVDCQLIDHYTYVIVGDGCLMEGISHEVCSLAGTLKLSKLIVFYDDNGISIDGKVEKWFTDDTTMRFHAYNWQVITINGFNSDEINAAIIIARAETMKPSLIICKTIIGYGSLLAGSEKSHGSPLGSAGVAVVRKYFNWEYSEFIIPNDLYSSWEHIQQGQEDENSWLNIYKYYQDYYPNDYKNFIRRINSDLPDDWLMQNQKFIANIIAESNQKKMATRKCSQYCIEAYGKLLPELLGGSADLTGSNNTNWSGSVAVTANNFHGNYLQYGVREFGMAAIMNGIAVHGGFIPYGGTFLVFVDYARNAVRLSALMRQRVIYILTHDSIAVGEDGPTHQPVEHIAMLRMTPNVHVWRPADLLETAIAWQKALMRHNGPTALLLSRQDLPQLSNNLDRENLIGNGGYIIYDCTGLPDVIIISTGSELQLAIVAAEKIHALTKHRVRVVAMPCCEVFLEQSAVYQEQVLPNVVRCRIAVEAAVSHYWYKFVGLDGAVIGVDRFGVSATGTDALQYLNITVDHILMSIKNFFNLEM